MGGREYEHQPRWILDGPYGPATTHGASARFTLTSLSLQIGDRTDHTTRQCTRVRVDPE